MRRCCLPIVLVALIVPATADAAFTRGHYVSGNTCAEGSGLDCHDNVIFVAGKGSVRNFQGRVACTLVFEDAQGGGGGRTYVLPDDRSFKVDGAGRFDSGEITDEQNGGTVTTRIRGRLQGKRFKGRVDIVATGSGERPYRCSARDVPLRAAFAPRPYYRTGHYEGTTSCFPGAFDCPVQEHPLSFTVRRGRITDFETRIDCRKEDGTVVTRSIDVARIPIDWAGRFSLDGTRIDLNGRIVGKRTSAHEPNTSGPFLYYSGDAFTGEDCTNDIFVFSAARVRPLG